MLIVTNHEGGVGIGETAKALGVKFVDLANEFTFVQVIIPEPEGQDAKFTGRIGESLGKRKICHKDTVVFIPFQCSKHEHYHT